VEEWGDDPSISAKQLKKRALKQIDRSLVDLKLVYSGQIKWGKLYGRLLEDGSIMEFA
jgi:hypothetical protein